MVPVVLEMVGLLEVKEILTKTTVPPVEVEPMHLWTYLRQC